MDRSNKKAALTRGGFLLLGDGIQPVATGPSRWSDRLANGRFSNRPAKETAVRLITFTENPQRQLEKALLLPVRFKRC
jgi:hypothetical protein